MRQFPPLHGHLMGAILGIIFGADIYSCGNSKPRVDRNCGNVEGRVGQNYGEQFLVNGPKYTKLHCHWVMSLQTLFWLTTSRFVLALHVEKVAKSQISNQSFWAQILYDGEPPKNSDRCTSHYTHVYNFAVVPRKHLRFNRVCSKF